MEDGALGILVMDLHEDSLFLGIGTTDGGAIGVAPLHDLPGANALDPGHLFGMFLIGGAQNLSAIGSCGAGQPLEIEAGDHVFINPVAVIPPQAGIERLES